MNVKKILELKNKTKNFYQFNPLPANDLYFYREESI